MPKLPVLSGKDIVRAGVGCVVPLHKEVKTGTPAGIIRQAGVTADEFVVATQ